MVSVPADAGAQVRSGDTELFPVTIHQREEESVMADRTDAAAGAASTNDPEGGRTLTRDDGTAGAPVGSVSQQGTTVESSNHVLTIRTETPEPAPRQPLSLGLPDNVNLDEERAGAVQAERDRITYIQTQVQRFNLDAAIGERLINDGVEVEPARVQILDELAEVHPGRQIQNTVIPMNDTREQDIYSGIRGALLHRYAPSDNALDDNARRFRGLSLIEMARHCLIDAGFGRQIEGLARQKVAAWAMQPGYGEGVRAMHSTSDFANVLADVANKTLRDAYDQSPRTFTPFCRRTTAVDFKGINRVALSEAPALEKVNESGEFRSGVMSDTKETYALVTYGKVVGITRQVIVNDDLDAFTRVPQLFGSAAAQKESDIVYFVILNNANQADGTPLFDANHGNLAASGGAISVTTVGAGRTAMAKQTGIDGTTLINVTPRYLVVPSDLETTAQQFLSQSLTPATTATVVPEQLRSSLTPLAEPRLAVGVTLDGTTAAGSLTAWYLAADPSTIDTIEYAFLEGEEGVSIETKNGFEVDGVQIRARLDFAAKAIDHRGLYKNAGA